MSYVDRVKNFLNIIEYGVIYYMDRIQRAEYAENFPAEICRSYDEMAKNMSLILFNQHFGETEVIRPYCHIKLKLEEFK